MGWNGEGLALQRVAPFMAAMSCSVTPQPPAFGASYAPHQSSGTPAKRAHSSRECPSRKDAFPSQVHQHAAEDYQGHPCGRTRHHPKRVRVFLDATEQVHPK